jgi:hypothetical protein
VRRRGGTELQSASGGSRSARASSHDWYSGELRPKVARAVAEGRVDASRADELHRLMTQLLEVRLDGRATR